MIVHEQTAAEFDLICTQPPHALLISGDEGAGKTSLALELAKKILVQDTLEADSSFRHYSPEKSSIGIEIIRELQKFLYLKTTGSRQIRRIVLIEDAHTMTHEAQNALLKVLEEPPSDTVIILTAVPSKQILPTIYSRVQQLEVKTPTASAAESEYTKLGYTSADITKAYSLSNGQQGLMKALLEQNTEHKLVEAIGMAKGLLSKPKFERLVMVDEIAKQKNSVPQLLKALKRIARSGLLQAASQGKDESIEKWHGILGSIQETERMLAHNPNTKLLLTNLMLTI